MIRDLKIRFWGVRGSVPTPGKSTVKYGGNTPCVELRHGDDIYIFDAGTGLRVLGNELIVNSIREVKIFLSHLHWDHIQGFPFFRPAYDKNFRLSMYGEAKRSYTFEQLLSGHVISPYFPVSIKEMRARINFVEIKEDVLLEDNDLQIRPVRLNHPDGCLGFRVGYKGKTFVYATDTEHFSNRIDQSLLDAACGADLIIYDCNYTDEEYSGKVGFSRLGWGHSTWTEGIKLAKEAGVKRFIMFHHDPDHNDKFITELEKKAQKEFKDSFAAYEGMEIRL